MTKQDEKLYGDKVRADQATPQRGVITNPQRSAGDSSNLFFRIGHATEQPWESQSWQQTEHVVMTDAEARAFANRILELVGR